MSERSRFSLAVLGLACLAPASALAEEATDRTGTGGGPRSMVTAPNTTSVGQTKPPGSEIGPETPGERRERDAIRRENDAIDDSICAGCGTR